MTAKKVDNQEQKLIAKVKESIKEGQREYNQGKCYSLHYTQDEIDAIDDVSDEYALYLSRMLNIKL
jgi:hypothetical protein